MQVQNWRKGPWFEEEDEQLTTIVGLLGERRWDALAKASGLRRNGKSCRLRWMNYLRPNLRRDQISEEEEQIIMQFHQKWGNKWSKIARRLPGRTDNEVKNYWRSHLRKKLVVQEQGTLRSVVQKVKQNVLVSNCEGTSERAASKSEDSTSEKDETSGSCGGSWDGFELSQLTFPTSPYEKRLSDWISSWSNDPSDNKLQVENCTDEHCVCYLASFSGESENSMWSYSSSIWDMD